MSDYFTEIDRELEAVARGHVWKRDEDGHIDVFAYQAGRYCNGPMCVNCGFSYCRHCYDQPFGECTKTDG